MPYNLRSKNKRQELLDNVEDPISDLENISTNESSTESEQSEDGSVLDSPTADIDDDLTADELQNAVDNERANTSRARGRPQAKLYGKNKFVWDTRVSSRRSSRTSNISSNNAASLTDDGQIFNSLEEFWDQLFDSEIINIIVENTNAKIEETCTSLVADEKTESYHHHTDPEEIRAYIGVLYYSGLWKSTSVDTNELWDKSNGITFYRSVFPRARFGFLQSCLRFDNRNTRDENDRFAPIRAIWTSFIKNFQKYYNPSDRCTVDEQLLSFRGRCLFRMYIKSKPDKYGLKLVTLNDADTAYLYNAVPYLGKTGESTEGLPVTEYFFTRVTTPIHGSNRTVTCDNWFSSVPLFNRMLVEPYNLSMTGTIKKNKMEIPLEFKIASKDIPHTKFCNTKDLTLLSFTPKKNKIVLVLSSYMHSQEITNGKPNIILHYNDTKGGTDTFDQLCHAYTVARKTYRWPMRVFYGMLDQAIVNARILWRFKAGSEKCTAIECMKKIITHLITPFLKNRLQNQIMRKDLKISIRSILKLNDNAEVLPEELQKLVFDNYRRCTICSRKSDKKTKIGCSACGMPVCDNHRFVLCSNCSGN